MILSNPAKRAILSVITPIPRDKWFEVAAITFGTTTIAGMVATATGFVNPADDWHPTNNPVKPLSAFFFPSLVEEVFRRGALLPHSILNVPTRSIIFSACTPVLAIQVISHPIAAKTLWPRGKGIFDDPRFLLLATIVLGAATMSFIVSGGSAWAAAVTHGLPVALWRDFFNGEARLAGKSHHQ
ncbi:unnamed protein product [Cylindrotheca closterium]|uniref:Uncharacterized protein n=1 Tax=Cylindrotheca closterium TaxID=2856 RepID=A0AAD2G923_9STRA|nr:unnamed protein product [Cylindrotheca closterium]